MADCNPRTFCQEYRSHIMRDAHAWGLRTSRTQYDHLLHVLEWLMSQDCPREGFASVLEQAATLEADLSPEQSSTYHHILKMWELWERRTSQSSCSTPEC